MVLAWFTKASAAFFVAAILLDAAWTLLIVALRTLLGAVSDSHRAVSPRPCVARSGRLPAL